MQLIVLGTDGPYPGASKACSGYLLSYGNTKILLDCGSGVLARLQCHQDLNQLSAVVLSHLHYDHISDHMYCVSLWMPPARPASAVGPCPFMPRQSRQMFFHLGI